jgi:hypothetical protein
LLRERDSTLIVLERHVLGYGNRAALGGMESQKRSMLLLFQIISLLNINFQVASPSSSSGAATAPPLTQMAPSPLISSTVSHSPPSSAAPRTHLQVSITFILSANDSPYPAPDKRRAQGAHQTKFSPWCSEEEPHQRRYSFL